MTFKARWIAAAVLGSMLGAGVLSGQDAPSDVTFLRTSQPARRAYLSQAVIWREKDLPSPEQIVEGPPRVFPLDRRQANPPGGVPCTWEGSGTQLRGKTEKFRCRTASGALVRVKYYTGDPQTGNREVFAEVIATRLFWALGFNVDVVFPVTVNCLECPANPMTGEGPRASRVLLGVIEPQFEGAAIVASADVDEGWTFEEFDKAVAGLDPGAERDRQRTHFDSLSLLAVFVKHGDRKASQQRLVCTSGLDRAAGEVADLGRTEGRTVGIPAFFERAGAQACRTSAATIQDLGATFGDAGRFTRDRVAKLDLNGWSGAVFRSAGSETKGPRKCDAKLVTSLSSRQISIRDPRNLGIAARVGEAGRRHLAGLLSGLSDAHIRALFEAGRVDVLGEPTYTEPGTGVVHRGVDGWVAAFKHKRIEIVRARCTD
jgi:hypothetical protein